MNAPNRTSRRRVTTAERTRRQATKERGFFGWDRAKVDRLGDGLDADDEHRSDWVYACFLRAQADADGRVKVPSVESFARYLGLSVKRCRAMLHRIHDRGWWSYERARNSDRDGLVTFLIDLEAERTKAAPDEVAPTLAPASAPTLAPDPAPVDSGRGDQRKRAQQGTANRPTNNEHARSQANRAMALMAGRCRGSKCSGKRSRS